MELITAAILLLVFFCGLYLAATPTEPEEKPFEEQTLEEQWEGFLERTYGK